MIRYAIIAALCLVIYNTQQEKSRLRQEISLHGETFTKDEILSLVYIIYSEGQHDLVLEAIE